MDEVGMAKLDLVEVSVVGIRTLLLDWNTMRLTNLTVVVEETTRMVGAVGIPMIDTMAMTMTGNGV